ncbi:unnamed protein product [Paramecium octaurelia]|uniref:Uncharacterized protein n=1 Tax=Paramecium octaurelia TaxID=43137 RepID=A0A8S1WXR6_PAROT|nr:unnamed protein product [Paramecium octaurelia]
MINSKSDVILEKCLTMMRPEGLEQFHFRIEEQFYKVKQNKVLLIHEKEGDDLQTMIAYWIQEHQQRNRDLIIPYIVEHENQNHYYAIYYILTKLRAVFNITQKVELESEKLKQYFEYWLNLCSRELGNQLYSDCKVAYKRVYHIVLLRVIIVIQGIDKFYSGGEVRVSSWLPKILPDNIKLIASARFGSKAYEYYQSIGNPIIPIENESIEIWDLIRQNSQIHNALMLVPEQLRCQLHFLKVFHTILSNPLDEYAQLISEVLQQAEKFQTEVEFFTILVNQFCHHNAIASSIFCVLSYVNKGISIDEVMASCSCTQEQFIKVYDFFKICFLEKNLVYSIYILTMRQAIQQIQFSKNLYDQYLLIIEHSTNSTRKLEELIQQYSKNKKYFKLKEIIINIEHFLILWNPYNKFELCQLWEMLEQNGYDLVMEYNKAVENFQAIYKPTTEGLFFIMLQICIFLREFSNFEKEGTPAYKHPLLRGQSIEFEEVGLYGELSQLKMLSKKKPKQQLNEDYFPTIMSTVQLENLNLDIKNNRDSFINYYQSQFDSNILQEYLQTKQDFLREKLLSTSKVPNPYYYKRWLWVQFPWLALTQKNNFSKLMQFYGKDSTQYMSIQEEIQINQKAIRLVINAKSSKDKSIHKLPEIKQRYYSPTVNKDEPVRRFNQSLEKSIDRAPSTGRRELPENKKKVLYIKKYNQLQYQNQQLKNKLKELQTVKQNLYPQEATIEAYRLNDQTKTQGDELKKQMDNLQGVQNEMKRMQTVLKLCQFNQDQNEERVQQLFRHCKNLDRMINEYKQIIKELSEKLGIYKQKNKVEPIKQQQLKQPISKQFMTMKDLSQASQKNMTTIGNINLNMNTDYKIKVTFDLQDQNNKNLRHQNSINNNLQQQDKLRETQTRLMLEQMPSNRMITPGYRLSLKPKGDVGDQIDSHILEQIRHLNTLGIANTYNNPTFDEFLGHLTKQNELNLEVQECSIKLNEVRIKKQEKQTFLKILQKNEKPQDQKAEQFITSDDVDKLRRANDAKTITLKKLKQQKAVYNFFHNNLYKDITQQQPKYLV